MCINFFVEIMSEESKCSDDLKKALKAVELYLSQSGLYYDNNSENRSTKSTPTNSIKEKYSNGNLDDSKIDNFDKELKELTREVQRLSTMEDLAAFKGLKAEVIQLKKDSLSQQTLLTTHLKPVMDRLFTLSADLDSLKNEVKAMKGLKLAPGSMAPFKVGGGKSAIYVRVALVHNRQEVHEFPTDENGNLSFTAVNAVYPGKQ